MGLQDDVDRHLAAAHAAAQQDAENQWQLEVERREGEHHLAALVAETSDLLQSRNVRPLLEVAVQFDAQSRRRRLKITPIDYLMPLKVSILAGSDGRLSPQWAIRNRTQLVQVRDVFLGDSGLDYATKADYTRRVDQAAADAWCAAAVLVQGPLGVARKWDGLSEIEAFFMHEGVLRRGTWSPGENASAHFGRLASEVIGLIR